MYGAPGCCLLSVFSSCEKYVKIENEHSTKDERATLSPTHLNKVALALKEKCDKCQKLEGSADLSSFFAPIFHIGESMSEIFQFLNFPDVTRILSRGNHIHPTLAILI